MRSFIFAGALALGLSACAGPAIVPGDGGDPDPGIDRCRAWNAAFVADYGVLNLARALQSSQPDGQRALRIAGYETALWTMVMAAEAFDGCLITFPYRLPEAAHRKAEQTPPERWRTPESELLE